MLRRLLLNRIDAFERMLGEPLDYMRFMVRASLGGFFKFSVLSPALWTPGRVPAGAYYMATLVACRHGDCGPCLQLVVNFARKAGVPADALRAALDRRPELLDPDLEDVYRFAEAVVEATGEDAELRERVRERYGDEGVVGLSLAIAQGSYYPVIKRGLGYATSCALVDVRV